MRIWKQRGLKRGLERRKVSFYMEEENIINII
jgi:hypothetical protein